jgi:serine/threonine protein kinase
MAPNTDPIP